MKLRSIGAVALLTFASASFAADPTITLPSAEVLTQQLTKMGLSEIVERTQIIALLADKKKLPIGVHTVIEQELAEYEESIGNTTGIIADQFRGELHTAILKHFPDALKEVQELCQ